MDRLVVAMRVVGVDAVTGDHLVNHKMWRSGIVSSLEEDSHTMLLSDALKLSWIVCTKERLSLRLVGRDEAHLIQ